MLRRYSRQLLLPELGVAGQERLTRARVLCVGAGGLGCPALSYLTAAGIGRIGVLDDDIVDITNLQRQVLYSESGVGRSKALIAAKNLKELNSDIGIDAIPVRLNAANARELVRLYDVVLDCTDSFSTRYLLNDACVLERKPLVFGSIYRFSGQVTVFATQGGPCLRCLFPEKPPAGSVPSCSEGGVLGALAGIIGSWQANEALKLILGIGDSLIGRLALFDAASGTSNTVILERDESCAMCGSAPSICDLIDDEDDEEEDLQGIEDVHASEVDDFFARNAGAVLLDVREPHEAILGALPGSLCIPASRLATTLHTLDATRSYLVACRVGVRSLGAARMLVDAGFPSVFHLNGGLLAHAAHNSLQIDLF